MVVNISGGKGYELMRIGVYTSNYIKLHVLKDLSKQNISNSATRLASSLFSPLSATIDIYFLCLFPKKGNNKKDRI
ncbi:hypothetical protein [Bacillus paranthracis]|uniref:hypothetical protein n=1 Tax=Bacillus paranthracis TaxID=2026186 RepID=UPI0021D0BB2A|nr:hypothetical protein [Bacillus paranthracis]MCU5209256.1 hypothetical protein [Bacillus paranthracis]HDR7791112.1 hypothetical protein [Bacillus paranthracis]